MKVYGPYYRKQDSRRFVVIHYDDGSKTTKLLARFLMEEHLGRKLGANEDVDHINDDVADDRIENLQVLPTAENIRKSHKPKELFLIKCVECEEEVYKEARNIRGNWKKHRTGPFCSRRCAGIYSARIQYNGGVVKLANTSGLSPDASA